MEPWSFVSGISGLADAVEALSSDCLQLDILEAGNIIAGGTCSRRLFFVT